VEGQWVLGLAAKPRTLAGHVGKDGRAAGWTWRGASEEEPFVCFSWRSRASTGCGFPLNKSSGCRFLRNARCVIFK